MATITLPDSSVREIPDGSTVAALAESIGRGLAKAAVVAKLDGKLVDLSAKLTGKHDVAIVTDSDPDGLFVLRHSTAHVLAEALRHLYGAQLQYTIGPVIENGFFYDFEFPKGVSISADDLPKIEAEMAKIIAANETFSREDVAPDQAKSILHDQSQRFKDEIIDELAAAGEKSVSIYRQGDFTDLCRGPHIPSTGKIKAFKLLSVAGAYWRGDSNRAQLTRIYGTAFFDKKKLDEHLKQLDEAKKRDHRVLGPHLGLFTIDDKVGQGLVLWKPKGAEVRLQLQNFISTHLRRQGYSQVFTPHIGRLDLYKTSGHFPYYRDSQFPPIVDREFSDRLAKENCGCAELSNRMEKGDIDGYLLKPMNCPHHIRIYSSEPHSYRDLPIRLAEFGTVYRWEKSGELGGMTRVRGFTQDDAHLFCTEEQVPGEIRGCLELVKIVLGTLGMNDYRVRVGLRDPDKAKFVGDSEKWDRAERACIDAASSLGVSFTEEPGEGAFYGPKIDFVVKDVIGREWQLGTVQVDYVLPERFDLSYTGPDNKPHRPVMIHRAPFGSMERFIGVLTEHFAGAFPLWLAPIQATVLSVSEKSADYAIKVFEALKLAGLRATAGLGAEKIGFKIREATLQKIPFMLVVGEQEAAANLVNVRPYFDVEGTLKGNLPVTEFIEKCVRLSSERWHPAHSSPSTAGG
ncbi:MAG: threonine--tRNA ligase [Phycisphaerae bacterium]|nr:threonine--tRNA ligase [Phycisphaerae bacterium]